MKPTIINENGYRYYDKNGLIKLQTILALKSMDYSLDQIKVLLNRNEAPHNPRQNNIMTVVIYDCGHFLMGGILNLMLRESRKRDTREKIVRHAVQLFKEKGYDNVTVDEITQVCVRREGNVKDRLMNISMNYCTFIRIIPACWALP